MYKTVSIMVLAAALQAMPALAMAPKSGLPYIYVPSTEAVAESLAVTFVSDPKDTQTFTKLWLEVGSRVSHMWRDSDNQNMTITVDGKKFIGFRDPQTNKICVQGFAKDVEAIKIQQAPRPFRITDESPSKYFAKSPTKFPIKVYLPKGIQKNTYLSSYKKSPPSSPKNSPKKRVNRALQYDL
jgi:hypothetical protein